MTAKSLLLIIVFVVNGCLSEDGPSVVTNSGKIRGHYLTSYKGNKYEAYQGIPYAEPPVGNKRFQPPVPIQAWSSELNATELKKWCAQGLHVIGTEDCLYLNVYVPLASKKSDNESFPVIVYIHGGNFIYDGVKDSEETYVMDHDVIFVSLQYRLGVLGFLSTEDEVVPGNMGLKDQSTALRWLHNNIESFGGDPKRIAIVGYSAGGVSVHLHYLSPWSTGLFHAGLSMSGTALAPWSIYEQQSPPREKMLELARSLKCPDEDVACAIECLRGQSVEILVSHAATLPSIQFQPIVPFRPIVEKSGENPFIDDFPSEIISKGNVYDVPWTTGVVSDEALGFLADYASDEALQQLNATWFQLAPLLLDFFYSVPMHQLVNVSQSARKYYFGEKPMNKENFRLLVNMASDRLFKASAGDAALSQATKNKSPVFFYHNGYRATDSITVLLTNSSENLGVAHTDDIGLVLKGSFIDPTKSMNDMAMQERLINIWISIAKYGVPKVDVEWQRVNPNSSTLDYLQIDDPSKIEMKSSEDFGQSKFWKSIIKNQENT